MIFRQVDEILNGTKTQTRRIIRYDACGTFDHDQRGNKLFDSEQQMIPCAYRIDKTYAVVPKRGQRAVWWKPHCLTGHVMTTINLHTPLSIAELERIGYQQLRIRVLAVRREALHDISDADAREEGVTDAVEYQRLWEQINGKKSWERNPQVWVIEFEVVRL